MTDYSNIVAVGIVAAIAIPIVLLVSAVLLRAAVHLYNRCVGGPESPRAVPAPSFNKAIGIALLVAASNWLLGTLVNYGGDIGEVNGPTELEMFVPSLIVEVIVMSVVLAHLLPTRFSRAFGVTICHTGICVFAAATIILVGIAGSVVISATM
jgi:hypothetical protein